MNEIEFYLKDLESRFKYLNKKNIIYLIAVVKTVIFFTGLLRNIYTIRKLKLSALILGWNTLKSWNAYNKIAMLYYYQIGIDYKNKQLKLDFNEVKENDI